MIKLTHPDTGQSWSGPISADFSVQASSQYSSPFADNKQGLHDKLMGAQQVWQNMTSRLGIEAGSIPIASMKTLLDSVSVWSGTEKPVFSIPITFIATSYKDNVQAKAVKLVSMVYPSNQRGLLQGITDSAAKAAGGAIEKASSLTGGSIKQNNALSKEASFMRQELVAPGGFAPMGATAKGTYMLELGTWFRATGLILQDASIELSKERMPNGHARGLLDKATKYISNTDLGKSAINAVKSARDFVDSGAKSLNDTVGKAADSSGKAINDFLK